MNRFNEQRQMQLLDGSYGDNLVLQWSSNQPDNYKNQENCAHVKANSSLLNDIPCNFNLSAYIHGLCEKLIGNFHTDHILYYSLKSPY